MSYARHRDHRFERTGRRRVLSRDRCRQLERASRFETVNYSIAYHHYNEDTVFVRSDSGDFESVYLRTILAPGHYLGYLQIVDGSPAPGDGILQINGLDRIEVTHYDPLGLSAARTTAIIGSEGALGFTDRLGSPVDQVLAGSPIRLRAFSSPSNADPTTVDSVAVAVSAMGTDGFPLDSESLIMVETGPNTALFTGELPSTFRVARAMGDGVLQVWSDVNGAETIEATLGATTTAASLRAAVVRLLDRHGERQYIEATTLATVEVEMPIADVVPTVAEQVAVRLRSLTSHDEEIVYAVETGPHTGIFRGSIATALAPAELFTGTLDVQEWETITATVSSYDLPEAVDQSLIIYAPPNSPPIATDDNAWYRG